MANFKDILKLCERDGGKVFVVDESGEVKLVIMDFAEYEDITQDFAEAVGALKEVKEVLVPSPDPEEVNRQIVDAQLTDAPTVFRSESTSKDPEVTEEKLALEPRPVMASDSLRLGNVLQERMRQWPKAYTVPTVQTQNGNSEESIDPSFDFEGPKFRIDDI